MSCRIAVIHASPPCQRYSPVTTRNGNPEDWPDLIEPVRERLLATGCPYVIENVMSAPLDKSRSIVLCADNMGLRTVRHRRFEYSPGLTLIQPPHKPHRAKTATKRRKERWDQGWHVSLTGDGPGSHVGPEAMGIDWMTGNELCEAIPPAYTEYVGNMILPQIETDDEKPILLDLFCGAGGAAMGYYRAGFEVIGVDINPMPHYPFKFIQADALNMLDTLILGGTTNDARIDYVIGWGYGLKGFAAVHASPPCQRYSDMSKCRPGLGEQYPDMIHPARERLEMTGLPYVIENVTKAPLKDPVTLCATQFRDHSTKWNGVTYELQRHRGFETNWNLPDLGACRHQHKTFPVYGHGQPGNMPWFTGAPMAQKAREVMGADWMTRDELAESIPPDFTHYVGGQLLRYMRAREDNAATVAELYDVPQSMLGKAA